MGIFVVVPLCKKPQGAQTCSPLPALSFWDDPKELCLPRPAGRPSAGVPWGLAGRRCHPLMSPILLQVQTRASSRALGAGKSVLCTQILANRGEETPVLHGLGSREQPLVGTLVPGRASHISLTP